MRQNEHCYSTMNAGTQNEYCQPKIQRGFKKMRVTEGLARVTALSFTSPPLSIMTRRVCA